MTQKCVVCKVTLLLPSGVEVETRPSESRLFRPSDSSLEDIQAVTATLQEALAREKALEDKIVKVDKKQRLYILLVSPKCAASSLCRFVRC